MRRLDSFALRSLARAYEVSCRRSAMLRAECAKDEHPQDCDEAETPKAVDPIFSGLLWRIRLTCRQILAVACDNENERRTLLLQYG